MSWLKKTIKELEFFTPLFSCVIAFSAFFLILNYVFVRPIEKELYSIKEKIDHISKTVDNLQANRKPDNIVSDREISSSEGKELNKNHN